MKSKNLVQAGYKNTVYYLKNYQVVNTNLYKLKVIRLIYQSTPLFQIRLFKSPNHDQQQLYNNLRNIRRKKTISQKKFQLQQFDKILILHSNITGNAKRLMLLNTKRSCLIQFLNRYSQKNLVYFITLSKIAQFVPEQHIIDHMKQIFQLNQLNFKGHKCNNNNDKLKQQHLSSKEHQSNIFKILFPFNLLAWSTYVKTKIKSKYNNLRLQDFQQNLIQIQIFNAYKIQYAKNSQSMYEDIKDLNKMLNKFNFIRYFNKIQTNQVHFLKNCQRLIKAINWKTHETEQYLLFIFRNQPWHRFFIIITNFLQLFQLKFNLKQPVLE